jgi:hypothetical protein
VDGPTGKMPPVNQDEFRSRFIDRKRGRPNVSCGSKADLTPSLRQVRFAPLSRHGQLTSTRPLGANSRQASLHRPRRGAGERILRSPRPATTSWSTSPASRTSRWLWPPTRPRASLCLSLRSVEQHQGDRNMPVRVVGMLEDIPEPGLPLLLRPTRP